VGRILARASDGIFTGGKPMSTDYEDVIAYSLKQQFQAFRTPTTGYPAFNQKDRPEHYEGKRRYGRDVGEETSTNIEAENPVVFLAIEKITGIGDSVIAASMSFKQAVSAAQDFARNIEGEIFPERVYLPSAGSVRLRLADGSVTPYRVDPIALS
jgi:hypothetical protein